jgi:hypothetical protein
LTLRGVDAWDFRCIFLLLLALPLLRLLGNFVVSSAGGVLIFVLLFGIWFSLYLSGTLLGIRRMRTCVAILPLVLGDVVVIPKSIAGCYSFARRDGTDGIAILFLFFELVAIFAFI